MIANHAEVTFGLLRYILGGYRPSQTTRLTLSNPRIHGTIVRFPIFQDWYFTGDSSDPNESPSQSPSYPTHEKSEANIRV
jgi:hypothetical protein